MGHGEQATECLREGHPRCATEGCIVATRRSSETRLYRPEGGICGAGAEGQLTGRGRPQHIRNVFSYEDLALGAPAEVTLDTSFVVRVLVESEPGHAEAAAFMSRLVQNSSTLYYNRILEIELVEAAFRLAIAEQHGKQNLSKRRDGRVRGRAGRLSRDLFQRWELLLRAVPHLCIELDEVSAEVLDLMTKYGLASMDAAHVATAVFVDRRRLGDE